MPDRHCPFCPPEPERTFHTGTLVLGIWDGFPVSPGHALLLPKRHTPTWFEATTEEQQELIAAISIARHAIEERCLVEQRPMPDGYNVGINIGEAAGQTVFHLHLHVIPRYRGDVPNPRGGVRRVLPTLGKYPPGGDG